MTITFVSNFLNHHQTPVADELYKKIVDNYKFISTEPTPESFLNSGYPNCEKYPYNLLAYENKSNYAKALKLVNDSDIVIIGASSIPEFMQVRLSTGKPLIIYSERWHKEWKSYLFLPYHLINGNVWRNHISLRNKPVYLLCAGAFVTNDCNLIGAYPNKRFKWGYFTSVKKLQIENIIKEKQDKKIRMLWVSRFIDWKHPELPIKLAFYLKRKGFDFQIDMIGDGKLIGETQKLINNLNVADCVNIVGTMPNGKVIEEMKKSHIFLFTSDRQEGWGAALNEAMSNGCTVVASDLIGAVPFLLSEPNTGMIFKSGSIKSLQNKVELLLNNRQLCNEMALNAYRIMSKVWSPENASKNLLQLCQSILDDNLSSLSIGVGPCTKA
ncbi:MAG: glycosyltransferase [Flavobacterium sp.]|nr:glycosyltransferase [Flavobacterium sp.]